MAETILDNSLTSVARVKARSTNWNTDWDTLILSLINEATEYIEQYCGVDTFLDTTYTQELYNGYGGNRNLRDTIYLKHGPVTSVATVEYKVGASSWSAYDSDEYYVDTDLNAIRLVSGKFPHGAQNVRVTYDAGYTISFDDAGADKSLHDLPLDLTHACEKLALRWFQRRDREGMTSYETGGSTISFEKELSPDITRVLDKYTNVVLYH